MKNRSETWHVNYAHYPPFAGTWVLNNGIWSSTGCQRTQASGRFVVNPGTTFRCVNNVDGPVFAQAFTLSGAGYGEEGSEEGALRFTQSATNSSPVTLAVDDTINVDSGLTGTLAEKRQQTEGGQHPPQTACGLLLRTHCPCRG